MKKWGVQDMRKHITARAGALALAACLFPAMLAPLTRPASAEVVSSPSRAVEMLVQARVMAARCGWLGRERREELAAYAARAEMAAVRREGAARARRAVRQGRRAGSAAGCDGEGREMVLAVLEGAREAMRASGAAPASSARARPAQAADKPARAASKRRADSRRDVRRVDRRSGAREARKDARRASREKIRPAPASHRLARVTASSRVPRQKRLNLGASAMMTRAAVPALSRYRVLAANYYHELKCRRMDHDDLVRMWRKVRDMHMALLNRGERGSLARAKAAAAREGRARSC